MFWHTTVKPPPSTNMPTQSEALVATKSANDICFGQESDIELMDNLGNEFEDEETSTSFDVKIITDDLTGSSRSERNFPDTVCDYSPLLSFSFKGSWNSEASHDSCILDDYRSQKILMRIWVNLAIWMPRSISSFAWSMEGCKLLDSMPTVTTGPLAAPQNCVAPMGSEGMLRSPSGVN